MRRPRSTYVLIGLFFAALLCLWGLERAGVLTEFERDRRRGRVLPDLIDLKESEIRKLEIAGPSRRLVFERRGPSSWRLVEPSDVDASAQEVEGFLSTLRQLRKSPEAGALDDRPEVYGLAPPAETIRLWNSASDSPVAVLEIGRSVQDECFVRDGVSGLVAVTSRRALVAVERPVVEWRETALAPPGSTPVVGLAIRRGGLDVQVERSERGGWKLTSPILYPADASAVEKLLSSLGSLRVDPAGGFVADDVRDFAPYGLDPPSATVTLRTAAAGSPPTTLMVGSAPPDRPDHVYVRKEGEDDVVELASEFVADIPTSLNKLRSRHVAEVAPAAVDRIEVDSSDGPFKLKRDRLGWVLESAGDLRADRQQVDALVKAVADLQSAEFFESATIPDAGVDPPKMRVRIWQAGSAKRTFGDADVELLIGRHDPLRRVLYARSGGDAAILALPDAFISALPSSSFAFRDRDLPGVQPATVSKLTVVRPGRTTTLEPDMTPGTANRWRMLEPVQAPADTRAVTAALARLAQLRAVDFITAVEGNLSRFGLDAPLMEVRWESTEPGKAPSGPKSLRIGAQLKSDKSLHYATLSDFPAVFTIETGALMPFAAEFHDTRVLSFRPQTVRRIVLRSETRTLAYVRRRQPLGTPADWSAEPGTPTRGVDLSLFDDLITGLSELRTARFVQYQGPFPPGAELGSPRLSITVEFGGEVPPVRLRIGSKFVGGWVCAAAGEGDSGPVFLLEAPSWESMILGVEGGLPPIPDDLFAPPPPR